MLRMTKKETMNRPITVLGAGRTSKSPGTAKFETAYALIPLVIALPVVGYFLAAVNHLNIDQFAPLLFVISGLGMTAVFYLASEAQKAARQAEKLKAQDDKIRRDHHPVNLVTPVQKNSPVPSKL